MTAKLLAGASNGPVEAKILEEGKANGEAVIPAGAIVRGTASAAEDRVTIEFSRLRRLDGTEDTIQASAYDPDDRTQGLKVSRVWHEIKKVALTSALNFAGGLAEGLQDTTVKSNVAVKDSSIKNGLLAGTRDAAHAEAQEIMSDMRKHRSISQKAQPFLLGLNNG